MGIGKINNFKSDKVVYSTPVMNAFTDGSCSGNKIASWAFVITDDASVIHKDAGILTGDICSMYQIGGEMHGVIKAVEWAKSNNVKLVIYHDYIGLKLWVSDLFAPFLEKPWNTNNKWSLEYRKFIAKNIDYIVSMNHIKAHKGIYGNELADRLAGQTIKDYQFLNS